MASFFDEIQRNNIKSILLLVVFSLIFIAMISLIVLLFGGGLIWIALGVVLVFVYAAFVYFSGDKIVLKVSGAKQVEEKDYPYLFETIEGLASAAQLKMPDVYIMEDQNPNAFATGRNRNHSAVVVTSGLLKMMNKQELQGVLAHEMSHIYENDIKFMMIAIVFAGVIGIIAGAIRLSMLFGGIGGGGRNGGAEIILIIVALIAGIITPIVALLLKFAISRNREYMADANGARMIRDPAALASALKKLKTYSESAKAVPIHHANQVTEALYFTNPLKSKSLSNLLSTHPPLDERIKRLEQMY